MIKLEEIIYLLKLQIKILSDLKIKINYYQYSDVSLLLLVLELLEEKLLQIEMEELLKLKMGQILVNELIIGLLKEKISLRIIQLMLES